MIHLVAERFGGLMRFRLPGGQLNECTQARDVFEGPQAQASVAQRGLDTNAVIGHMQAARPPAVITSNVFRNVQRPLNRANIAFTTSSSGLLTA